MDGAFVKVLESDPQITLVDRLAKRFSLPGVLFNKVQKICLRITGDGGFAIRDSILVTAPGSALLLWFLVLG